MNNHIKLIFFLILLVLFSFKESKAQFFKKPYFNKSYLGFLPSVNQNGNAFTNQRGTLISTVNGLKLYPNFYLGVGVGIGAYVNPTYTNIPFFLDVNYYLFKKQSSPYIYGDMGYSFSTAKYIKGGVLLEGGFGWKFRISEHFNLGPQMGYRIQHINKDFDALKSISFGIAATF